MIALVTCTLIATIQQTADTEYCYYYNLPVNGTLKNQSLFGFFGDANTGTAMFALPNCEPEKRQILGIASNQCEAHCRHRISGEVLWYFFGPERVEWARLGDVGGTTRSPPALLEKYQRERGRKFGPGAWKDPAPGLAIDFLPVSYDACRVFFFVMKTKKIESWETEWAVQRWKNKDGVNVSGWKAVADERNPETINSAFAEDFYVFKRKADYFFVTQSAKLYIAPPPKKGEKSPTMNPLWDDAKRPIVAVIEGKGVRTLRIRNKYLFLRALTPFPWAMPK